MRKTLLSILIITAFAACKKDKVEPQPEPVSYYSINAGEGGANYASVTITNPTPFTIVWDSLNLYGVGNDSIDLNLDGTFDLYFVLNVLNPDSIHLLTGIPNPLPSLIVNSGSNLIETIIITESVPAGMGSYNTYTYANRLDSGMVISENDEWQGLEGYGKVMRTDSPGTGGPTGGPWSNNTGYLAVRYNGKYGWIHLDVTTNDNPLILGWAIEN